MANGFQFKQFFVAHDRCAMKVNTDGVLLGAIADTTNTTRILDLGAGTGLIALMLAQRSSAQVVAVELEPNAYQQAVENCKKSAFSDRLQVLNGDVMQLDLAEQYDLIVSNPPYFEQSLSARNAERDLARGHQSHLDWLASAAKHLSEHGKISIILPFDAAEKLIAQSPTLGLHCTEQWHIATKPAHSPKRMIATFQRHTHPTQIHTLTIYHENQQYSAGFKQLTQDFYLNF